LIVGGFEGVLVNNGEFCEAFRNKIKTLARLTEMGRLKVALDEVLLKSNGDRRGEDWLGARCPAQRISGCRAEAAIASGRRTEDRSGVFDPFAFDWAMLFA
jgi:hypothetical protein